MLEAADAGRGDGAAGVARDLEGQNGQDGEVDGDVVEREQQVLHFVTGVIEEPLVGRGGQHSQTTCLFGTERGTGE